MIDHSRDGSTVSRTTGCPASSRPSGRSFWSVREKVCCPPAIHGAWTTEAGYRVNGGGVRMGRVRDGDPARGPRPPGRPSASGGDDRSLAVGRCGPVRECGGRRRPGERSRRGDLRKRSTVLATGEPCGAEAVLPVSASGGSTVRRCGAPDAYSPDPHPDGPSDLPPGWVLTGIVPPVVCPPPGA